MNCNLKFIKIIIEERELSDESFLVALHQLGELNPMKKIQQQNGLDYLVREIQGAL